MQCKETHRTVLLLAEGTLAEAEKERLEMHLQECSRCKSFAARYMEAAGPISFLHHQTLSPRFWPRLHRRILQHDAREAERRRRQAAVKSWLRPLLASACLLVGIWAGIELGSAYSSRAFPESTQTSPPMAAEESMPFGEIFGVLPPGSLSELFANEYLEERSEQ